MTLQDLDRPTDASVSVMRSMLTKVRFAVLWLVAGSALAATMAVFFYEPGVLQEGVAGVMEGETVTEGMALLNAVMVAIPLIMAALVVFLPLRAAAIASLVVAVPLGAFGLYAVVGHAVDGELSPHLTLAALAGAIAWVIAGLSIAALRSGSHGAASADAKMPVAE